MVGYFSVLLWTSFGSAAIAMACFQCQNSNAHTQFWWGRSETLWGRSVTLWGRSVTWWGRPIILWGRSVTWWGRPIILWGRSVTWWGRSVTLWWPIGASRSGRPRPATRTWSADTRTLSVHSRTTWQRFKGSLGSPRSQAPPRAPQDIIILVRASARRRAR